MYICMDVYSECESARHVISKVVSIMLLHQQNPMLINSWSFQVCVFFSGWKVLFVSILSISLLFTMFLFTPCFIWMVSEHNTLWLFLLYWEIFSTIERDHSVNADFLDTIQWMFWGHLLGPKPCIIHMFLKNKDLTLIYPLKLTYMGHRKR